MVVVAIHRMQRLHGPLGAEIAAARAHVEGVEVPDHRGPGVVQHPLDHAGRGVLVAAVSLIHGADAFVSLHLRFKGIVLGAGGWAEASIQRVGEYVEIFEYSAAGVVVPDIVDRPEMVFPDHGANAFNRRYGRAHAGFGVEAIPAAAAALVALLG